MARESRNKSQTVAAVASSVIEDLAKEGQSSTGMGTSWSFLQPFGSGVATLRGKAS
jgi:hypothetical protein